VLALFREKKLTPAPSLLKKEGWSLVSDSITTIESSSIRATLRNPRDVSVILFARSRAGNFLFKKKQISQGALHDAPLQTPRVAIVAYATILSSLVRKCTDVHFSHSLDNQTPQAQHLFWNEVLCSASIIRGDCSLYFYNLS
jgi:hypothetical protein